MAVICTRKLDVMGRQKNGQRKVMDSKNKTAKRDFFFGWLLHGSTSPLSGRSPFCQLHLGEDVAKALDITHQVKQQRKLKQTKNQTTMQPPRECKGRVKVACSSDSRSRASWRRREHACRPSEGEGTACSKGWKVLRN